MARTNLRIILFLIFASSGGFLFGYRPTAKLTRFDLQDIGVISSCLVMPPFVRHFGELRPDGTYYLSTSRESIITSLLAAGTFCGALGQAFLANTKTFGRKFSISFWAVIFIIGCVVQTAAGGASPSAAFGMLPAGRFVAGLGVGALSALIPLYNSEAAPKHLRGPMVVMYQLMICAGIAWSYGLSWATSGIANRACWMVPVGFQLVLGVFIAVGILFLPESPRLLLGRGNVEGASKSIATLNAVPLDHPLVHEEIAELEALLAVEEQAGKGRWIDLLSTKHQLWKRTMNACMIQTVSTMQQEHWKQGAHALLCRVSLCLPSVYYFYGATFFAQSNTGLNSYQIQFILGMVTFVGCIPALWLIERMGRRKMLLYGGVGEIICALIAGLCGHFLLAPAGTPEDQLTTSNIRGGQLLVAFAIIQVLFFAMFWGPTPWVVTGEIFPLHVRAQGVAAATATNWLWNFLVGFFSSKIAADIGPLILLIFAGVLAFGCVYIYFFLIESSGLALEEIDEAYALHIPAWKSTSWIPPSRIEAARREGAIDEKGEIIHAEKIQRKVGGGAGMAH
ncbi:hypothetical protein QFC20_003552 [Naganishia adeliensis]|uniref:Uncharacterized protein n=1 Tax=Naganishia adeliensis TaxID=92952 RepID=A0ACC2W8W1_9TREE|nr:hypothetical protein QFC20_003552 [Naganishia adeliensis]